MGNLNFKLRSAQQPWAPQRRKPTEHALFSVVLSGFIFTTRLAESLLFGSKDWHVPAAPYRAPREALSFQCSEIYPMHSLLIWHLDLLCSSFLLYFQEAESHQGLPMD